MKRNRAWRAITESAATEWLGDRTDERLPTGLDAHGWERSTWILHAMYEIEVDGPVPTFDELRRSRVEAGLEEPAIVGDVNLDDVTIATGGPLGLVDRPEGSGWHRLMWGELALRLGSSLVGQKYPPCFRWFPYSSWPASIQPPPEGSLDGESLVHLGEVLEGYSGSEGCVALYSFLAAGMAEDVDRCFEGPVTALRDLVEPGTGRVGTPSNIWPVDQSWFVYTDWDLWGTKVSGPAALIDALEAHERLETLSWP